MITRNSRLREVYRHPVGKDVLDRILRHIGRSSRLIESGPLGAMRLAQLDRLVGGKAPGVMDMLVAQLAQHDETLPRAAGPVAHAWWKEAVVYQIYPRSFYDANGDGIGDLAGIREKIPYLVDLGVDAVWLSPIYDSPGDDGGYDIRDYKKIAREFGNLRDFNYLLRDLHKNGIRLIMDLVVNHTSDEHAWFKKALADPAAPQHDYYIWAEGRADGAPNNWTSWFAGSAWNEYEGHQQQALHLFSKKQMDLNWDNPALRAEIYEMVNWWLERGVDGFRLDVINLISKDGLADGNEAVGSAFGFTGIEHYWYGPRLHEYLRELRAETFAKHPGAYSVGEVAGPGLEMCRLLCAEQRGELDSLFAFEHLDNPGESRLVPYQYDARYWKEYLTRWQAGVGADVWPGLVFENHDNPRMVSKVNPDVAYRPVVAKMVAALLLTGRGTPFIYQGQELGMTNCRFGEMGQLRDVESHNRYAQLAGEMGPEAAFRQVAWGCRDHARTPMQWNVTNHAGFTKGEPWMMVNPNFAAINAEREQKNPDSVYHFYKRLIALRRAHPALVYGEYKPVFTHDKNCMCYFRVGEGERFYVEVNLSGEEQRRPGPLTAGHRLVAGSYGGVAGRLRAYEANVYTID